MVAYSTYSSPIKKIPKKQTKKTKFWLMTVFSVEIHTNDQNTLMHNFASCSSVMLVLTTSKLHKVVVYLCISFIINWIFYSLYLIGGSGYINWYLIWNVKGFSYMYTVIANQFCQGFWHRKIHNQNPIIPNCFDNF
jgi:hypothetical protein